MANVSCGSSWARLAEVNFSYGGLNEYKILLTRSNIQDDQFGKNQSDSSDDDLKREDGDKNLSKSSSSTPQESVDVVESMGFKFEKEIIAGEKKRNIRRVDLQINSKYGESLKMKIKRKNFSKLSSENKKYWHMRHSLFSRYDEGIELDQESWFSVTPEMLAKHISLRLKCSTIIDAFCGAGGNAIQFAMMCDKVIAIDIDPVKIKMARNNARIYGVEHKIVFINKDFRNFVPDSRSRADAVFLSPPWGGPAYRNKETFSLRDVTPDMDSIMEKAKSISKNIAVFLPRNTAVEELVKYSEGDTFEVEQNVITGRLKTVTVYYGNLINTVIDPIHQSIQKNSVDCSWRIGRTHGNLDRPWEAEKSIEEKMSMRPMAYKNFKNHVGTCNAIGSKNRSWEGPRDNNVTGRKLDDSVEDKLAHAPKQFKNFSTSRKFDRKMMVLDSRIFETQAIPAQARNNLYHTARAMNSDNQIDLFVNNVVCTFSASHDLKYLTMTALNVRNELDKRVAITSFKSPYRDLE